MNNLSWFLYVADVFPNVAFIVTFVSISVLLLLTVWVSISSGMNLDIKDKDEHFGKPSQYNFIWAFVLLLLASLIPSQETIYLIAGSEAGEYVAETEAGQAILNDVQEIIQIQLSNLKGDD
jgi:hypothetical protein